MLLETGASSRFCSGKRGGDFEASACCLTLRYLEYFAGAGGEATGSSFSSDIVSLSWNTVRIFCLVAKRVLRESALYDAFVFGANEGWDE